MYSTPASCTSCTFKHFWSHPRGTALIVGHVGLLIAGSTEVADLECEASVNEKQVGRLEVSVD